MTTRPRLRVLLIEDNPTDALLLKEQFAAWRDAEFVVDHVDRLADGLNRLAANPEAFDVLLLDLALPDSQGIQTFIRLRQQAPGLPVVVLTALEDEEAGFRAVQEGAQDYLLKRHIQPALLGRAVRYAIERVQLQRQLELARHHDDRQRELESVARLASPPATAVSALLYAGGSLRERLPNQFRDAVETYVGILARALEERIFRVENRCEEALRVLADQLGFWRAGPRDVVEIHTAGLERRLQNEPPARAQAYVEEGRLTLLQLMGNLTIYYRGYCRGPDRKDPAS